MREGESVSFKNEPPEWLVAQYWVVSPKHIYMCTALMGLSKLCMPVGYRDWTQIATFTQWAILPVPRAIPVVFRGQRGSGLAQKAYVVSMAGQTPDKYYEVMLCRVGSAMKNTECNSKSLKISEWRCNWYPSNKWLFRDQTKSESTM